MNFDFLKEYERYTTRALLQIVNNPQQYQPAAVEAAQDLLATRDAFSVAREKELLYQMPVVPEEASVPGIFEEPQPGYDPRHVLTIRILLILIFTYYATNLMWRIYPLFYALGNIDTYFWMRTMIFPFLSVILYTIIPILLWRNLAPGWHVAMVVSLYSLITRSGELLYGTLLGREPMTEGLVRTNALHIVLCGTITFLLWIPAMRDAFGISGRAKRWSMGLTIAVAMALEFQRFFLS